jgi:hypothetical protein
MRAPFAGLDTDNSQDYLADGFAPVLDNMLARGGRAIMRGGWGYFAPTRTATLGLNNATQGLMVFNDQMLLQIPGTAQQEHWNLTTATGTSLAGTPAIKSRRYAREGAYVYGPGTADPGNGIQLLRWPGGAVVPSSLSSAVAPVGACDVTAHLERVWVMGATLAGAGGVNSVMWSIPGGTSAVAAATDWQDAVSGLFNQIIVGATDDDDLVAFGKAARSLVIFKKRSTYVLTGQTPSTFQVQRFSSQIGCLDRDSVCSFNDGTYFLSDRGLMYFDGAQMIEVSKPIRSEIQYAIRRNQLFSPYTYYSVGDLGNGCLMVLIGNYGVTPGTVPLSNTIPFGQYIFDTVRGTWSKFSVGVDSSSLSSAPIKHDLVFWCNDRPLLSDGGQFGYADHIPAPEFPFDHAGYDEYWDVTVPGSRFKSLRARYFTRLYALDAPTRTSQVHRMMLDYRMALSSGGTPGPNMAWQLDLLDGSGVSLYSGLAPGVDSNDLTSLSGAARAGLYRQRTVVECFGEATDVQLRVTYPDQGASPPVVIEGSVFDGAIEFQATHMTGQSTPPS